MEPSKQMKQHKIPCKKVCSKVRWELSTVATLGQPQAQSLWGWGKYRADNISLSLYVKTKIDIGKAV